jgi:[pyruvate, water dikinase]-phosphate phosphotransferase / [pyruvate, water dikinase] kinase
MPASNSNKQKQPSIFVVSGGRGIAGNSMVQSLLIQYPDNNLPVEIIPHIVTEQQVFDLVLRAKAERAVITHTMVDPELRAKFNQLGEEFGVPTIDFMGQLADILEERLGIPPLKSPGLYREVNHAYFDRVEAIEFTLGHDDGIDARRLNQAEIVLTGVSRSGKTPLSVYLAMYGWKVANVPLVKGIDPPHELFEIDSQRVFGLHINASQLLAHRTKRMKTWGHNHNTDYIDERSIREEIRQAMFIFDKGNFAIMNVSNKPIESTANEILQIMNERFRYGGRKLESPYGKEGEPL